MQIKKANITEHKQIMEIYRYAQDYMIQSGNPDQWGHSYPSPELILSDIESQICCVVYDDDGIHGVFALMEGPDPTYQVIEDGDWLNDEPYLVIHRLAGSGKVHGIFNCVSDYCKSLSPNIRIDTHRCNLTMQRQIEKNGYTKCGTIYVRDGSARIAYQWTGE